MTEVEELRALLAEARLWVGHNLDCSTVVCDECALSCRIDDALAEPVVDPVQAWKDANGYDDFLDEYSSTVTERNEARAEVKRLTQALAMANQVSGVLCDDCGWAMKFPNEPCRCEVVKQRDEARAKVERLKAQIAAEAKDYSQDDVNVMTTDMIAIRKAAVVEAYRRGAEAMREKCAVYIQHASHEDGIGMGSQRMEMGIRALGLPEDKP